MGTPYAGNEDSFPSEVTILSGSDVPNSTNFNTAYEGALDRGSYNFKRVRSLNWAQSILPVMGGAGASGSSPYQTLACVGYDTLTQKWLVSGASSIVGNSANVVSTGYGDQTGWITYAATPGSLETVTGSSRSVIRGNEPSVSSKYVYAAFVLDASSHISISRIDTTVPTTTHQTTPDTSADLDCALATLPGVIIAALSASTSAHSNVWSSSNSGSTWTAQTALTISSAIGFWCLATNRLSTQLLAIPGIHGSSGGPDYLSSPDGTTWTKQTGLESVLGATEVPTSLTWGDDGTGVECWILTTFSTTTHFYRSSDGINWTSFTSDWPSTVIVDEIAWMSDARILVALVDETPLARVVYSLNGGANWHSCRVEAPILSSIPGPIATHHKLVAGPNQAAIACGAVLLLSSAIGSAGSMGAA